MSGWWGVFGGQNGTPQIKAREIDERFHNGQWASFQRCQRATLVVVVRHQDQARFANSFRWRRLDPSDSV
jgi:hypothetical protein